MAYWTIHRERLDKLIEQVDSFAQLLAQGGERAPNGWRGQAKELREAAVAMRRVRDFMLVDDHEGELKRAREAAKPKRPGYAGS